LEPTLAPGDNVIMDNLDSHQHATIGEQGSGDEVAVTSVSAQSKGE
jgi:hypothetical protein